MHKLAYQTDTHEMRAALPIFTWQNIAWDHIPGISSLKGQGRFYFSKGTFIGKSFKSDVETVGKAPRAI